MRHKTAGKTWCLLLTMGVFVHAHGQHPTLENTVICGYQGWFACYGDGSPVQRWNHWCRGEYRSDTPKPAAGNQTFELYPDVGEYPAAALFQTGYAPLGDGRPAKLFSSYPEETIDLHFAWMQQAGIDGVALQRFLSETGDIVYKTHRDSVAVRVRRAAEKYGRTFYLMYDGIGNDIDGLIADWQNTMTDGLAITSSPRYAYMDGKPVIGLWGFGFTHYSDNATEALRAVRWFKDNGYYVVGGVPTNWRTCSGDSKPGYQQVYEAYDMVSPWTPGRFKTDSEVDAYKTNYLEPDKARLDQLGIAYQPVMFPGFAWSNWNGGPPNDFPRRQGWFLWRQFRNIESLGVRSVYVAMFDEYDEATAIAKAATDASMVPGDQYFLSLSADGVWLSSDYYMRLIGAAGEVLKGTRTVTFMIPVPYSAGPVHYRNGFESRYLAASDAQYRGYHPVDPCFHRNATHDSNGVSSASVTIERDTSFAHSGEFSCRIAGVAASGAAALYYYRMSRLSIPVVKDMRVSFWKYTGDALGRYTNIDLVFKSGKTLRDSRQYTNNTGSGMHPGDGHGTVGEWQWLSCMFGSGELLGDEITQILVAYDHPAPSGAFTAYFDDITIDIDAPFTPTVQQRGSSNRRSERAWLRGGDGCLTVTGAAAGASVFSVSGRRLGVLSGHDRRAEIPLPGGVYIAKNQGRSRAVWKLAVP